MSLDLLLGIRLDFKPPEMIKLCDVTYKTKIRDLRRIVANTLNLPQNSFELIYGGNMLEEDVMVEFYGIKNGSIIHVIKHTEELIIPPDAKIIPDDTVLQVASTFKSFNENPVLRNALHRFSKKQEIIDNIISSCPGLCADSVAIAMLQDPDIMTHFTDVEILRRIADYHPFVIYAAQNIAAAIHKEARDNAAGVNAMASNSQPTAYSYSLDNLSDDEEIAGDSSQSSDSTQASNLPTSSSSSTITAAQLAAALNRAAARTFPQTTPVPARRNDSNSAMITAQMFSRAIQEAFASTPAVPPTLPPDLPPVLPQVGDLQRQLAQMREMGLQDDTINFQALQFTNGDVQAAIELVFSGFSDN